nr:hypothetical protein [Lachnospiraceae bacterium]
NMNIKRSNYYTEVDYDNSCYYIDNGRKVYFSFSTSQKVSGENMWIYLNDSFTPGKTYYVEFEGSDPIAISIPKKEEDEEPEPEPYVPSAPAAPYPATIEVTASQTKLNFDVDGSGLGFTDSITLQAVVRDQYGANFDIDASKISWAQDTTSKESFLIDPDLSFTKTNIGKYELIITPQSITASPVTEAAVTLTTKVTGYPNFSKSTQFTIKKAGRIQDLSTDEIRFSNVGESVLDIAIGKKTYLERASMRLCSYKDGYYTGDVRFDLLTSEPNRSNVSSQSAISYALLIKKNNAIIDPATTELIEVCEANGAADLFNFTPALGRSFAQADTGEYSFTLYKISWDGSYTNATISVFDTINVRVVNNQTYPTYTCISSRITAEKAAAGDYSDCFTFSFAGQTYNINTGYEVQVNYGFGTSGVKYVTRALVPVGFDYYIDSINQPTPLTFDLPCTINREILIDG